jgi:hypothetical protein
MQPNTHTHPRVTIKLIDQHSGDRPPYICVFAKTNGGPIGPRHYTVHQGMKHIGERMAQLGMLSSVSLPEEDTYQSKKKSGKALSNHVDRLKFGPANLINIVAVGH